LLRFGVHSGQQYQSFADCLELWRRAEDGGFDWVSVFDHYRPPLGGPDGPCMDGPTLLAALAARTSRVRCGLLVSAVTWRHPALAASIAATIDQVSGGRLEFGLGAAGPDLGYEQFGVGFPDVRTRMDMLEESCRVVRSLWTQERTDFTGRHFRLTGACLEPKPVQPHLPLVIGGSGEKRLLGIVARHADIWNTSLCAPPDYRRKLGVLAGHCATANRNPADIGLSITFRAVLAGDERKAERRRAERLSVATPAADLGEYLTFGTPDQCVADLLPYVRLGVRDFLLGCRPPLDWETMELFATEVIPALRAAADTVTPSRPGH
jgi:alkanesulfonate monooxygenase SsuD/methylene tetrahydromethanopterin reductase-like flavin-dependent oxidoreductase (luciferase family)